MKVEFGTDGIRGEAGAWPITPEVGRAVGRAAALLANASGGRRVVIGRDPRPSGGALARAVAAGVAGVGGVALDAGMVPTAATGLAVHGGLADAGVMITASHNPQDDNGFKVLGPGGRKLDDAACAAVEAWLAEPADAQGSATPADVSAEVGDLWRRSVLRAVPDRGALHGRKVAIDLANGAGTAALPWLSDALGCALVLVGTGGPVNGDCGSEHPGALAAAVRQQGCDGGFALDGDGDRCRVVDEQGRLVPGDAVTWLLARASGADGVAVTVMSNGALERLLPGVRVVRTPVGDRHLAKAMAAHGLPLGAEESGHVLFHDHPAGDGLVAGLRALIAGWSGSPSLSQAFAGFVPLPRRLAKVKVGSRPPLAEVAPLQALRREAESRLGPHGRVFLRYSGTEPVLRILVEGEPEDEVERALYVVTEAARGALA